MRIKRIFTTLLIALMMFSIVAISASAAGEVAQNSFDLVVDMSSDSELSEGFVKNTEDGVTVDFTLKIVNNPGVNMLSVRLAYNTDKLEIVGEPVINTDVFSADKWEQTGVKCYEDGSIHIDFWTENMGSLTDSSFSECDLVTFTFKVKGDVDGKIDAKDFAFDHVDVIGPGYTPVAYTTDSIKSFEAHRYVAIEDSIKDPTCTESGKATYKCAVEGCSSDELTAETAPALGHDLVNHEAKEPNCTEVGWDAYDTCTRCDYTTYVEKGALGHDLGEWVETTKPTCTEKGVETQSCSRCDYVETRDVDAAGHNYEAVVTAPTCTADGFTTYTCSECDDTYVDDTVEKLEHNWGEWVETTAPTTTAKGENTSTCADCGATKTEEVAKLPVMTFASEEWKKGEGLTFISDAEFDAFVKVLVNGTELAAENYTVTKGDKNSTVVNLLDQYLETLEAGEYTISIESTSGTAAATFEIASGAWWIILIVVAVVLLGGGGVACVIFLKKGREND